MNIKGLTFQNQTNWPKKNNNNDDNKPYKEKEIYQLWRCNASGIWGLICKELEPLVQSDMPTMMQPQNLRPESIADLNEEMIAIYYRSKKKLSLSNQLKSSWCLAWCCFYMLSLLGGQATAAQVSRGKSTKMLRNMDFNLLELYK